MPKTMSEKILARAAGKDEVEAGDIVIANIDVAMTHDLTGPLSVQSFEKIGEDFGGKMHTTVINACNKVLKALKSDSRMVRDINAIKKEIGL